MADMARAVGRRAVAGGGAWRGRGIYARRLKRLFDLGFLVLILPVALPMVALAWTLARMDGGPGFYGHVRVGRDGRPFTCWKVRTMHGDAAARLVALLATDPVAAREWDAGRKIARDPRITRAGRVMRRLSIDELPQLWNVLRGEMSLIGPRPVTASELVRYGVRREHYLSCRPGMTGLWQVSGRNRLSYDERMRLDQAYAEGIGFLSDLQVLLRTVPVVIGMSGC